MGCVHDGNVWSILCSCRRVLTLLSRLDNQTRADGRENKTRLRGF